MQFPTLVTVAMSCPEMGHVFTAMSNDMSNKLGAYAVSLQARYGDPRVYAMQQEQMRRDEASVAHAKSKKTAKLLEDAYARQTERNQATHKERIANRARQKSSSPPESQQAPAPRRKPAPKKQPEPQQ